MKKQRSKRKPRKRKSGRIDLRQVFEQVQEEMLSHLSVRGFLDHACVTGAAAERGWIELFNRYLPERYRASSGFVVDADGQRSRQIDIVLYDRFYSPLLFWHEAGLHVPAESVYAVFEVKQKLALQWITDAGRKAASVRRLRRTSAPVPLGEKGSFAREPRRILAGVLASDSVWKGKSKSLAASLTQPLESLREEETLDVGCILSEGGFVAKGKGARAEVFASKKEEALIFFYIQLLELLRAMGNAPAPDLLEYGRSLKSFA